jgi:membrane-bound lytic murein transglycosylase F
MNKKAVITIGFSLLVVALCIALLVSKPQAGENITGYNTYQTISDNGYIRVGILRNTTDYYIENGNIRGFHYELVESFVKHVGLDVQYVLYGSYWDIFFALLNNEVDMLAMDVNRNFQRDVFFSYTQPHSYSTHVLVQRKDEMFVDSDLNIPDKDSFSEKKLLLAVPACSAFQKDVLKLCLGENLSCIDISVRESLNTNHFLDLLANKQIDLTVEDKKIMDVHSLFYGKLDYSVELSDTLPLHWAVNKGNFSLQNVLNHWLDSLKKTHTYPFLMKKYYSPHAQNRQNLASRQYKITNETISVYDHLVKKQAKRYDLDWRLVSAVIHQESRFKPNAVGRGGSYGLMQLMPGTMKQFKINDFSVEGQIASGCKLLRWLLDYYHNKGITDTVDLYKFSLAAYNAGHGRIDEVMLLTKTAGLNPHIWSDAEKIFPKMSDKKFVKDSELNIKPYNGTFTKDYVSRVWIVYRHYCNMVE